MVLIKVGHAIIQIDRTFQPIRQGERGTAPSSAERTTGNIIVPELHFLSIDGSHYQRNSQTNTNNRFL